MFSNSEGNFCVVVRLEAHLHLGRMPYQFNEVLVYVLVSSINI
jgi:hypothetical protein